MSIQDLRDITSFKWATVTGVSPLAIRLDGDTDPLALIPDSLVDPNSLWIGARVRVELSLRKCVIHGASSGERGSPYSVRVGGTVSVPAGATVVAYTHLIPAANRNRLVHVSSAWLFTTAPTGEVSVQIQIDTFPLTTARVYADSGRGSVNPSGVFRLDAGVSQTVRLIVFNTSGAATNATADTNYWNLQVGIT